MTRSEARSFVRMLVQDYGRISDSDMNAIIHDSYIGYKRVHDRWSGTFDGGQTSFNLTVGLSNVQSSVNAMQYVSEILAVHRQTSNTATSGTEMEHMERNEIIRLQNTDTTQAAPRFWHAERFESGTSNTNSTSSYWRLWVWPIVDGSYWFSARCLFRPGAMDSDGQMLELPEHEAYLACRDAARLAARLLGKPDEFVQTIDAQIEQRAAAGKAINVRGQVRRGQPIEVQT